jgi:hypothetical protein
VLFHDSLLVGSSKYDAHSARAGAHQRDTTSASPTCTERGRASFSTSQFSRPGGHGPGLAPIGVNGLELVHVGASGPERLSLLVCVS